MLRLYDSQLELWDAILPEELLRLTEDLTVADKLLDDERFMEPFINKFKSRLGRPTIPIERYLRLMYLKFYYKWGYEVLVKEVSDSIMLRRFSRIRLSEKAPHSTTLCKLTRRAGAAVVKELNEALKDKTCEQKLILGRKMQTDTTVIESAIHYPTDAGLLADGVRIITSTVKKIKEIGGRLAEGFRNSTRKMKSCLRSIGSFVRGKAGKVAENVEKMTAEALRTAERVVEEAKNVKKRVKRFVGKTKDMIAIQAGVLKEKLEDAIGITERIITQTQQRLSGVKSIPDRLVSIFDRDARPICRGLKSKPVEFGEKVQIDEVEGGFISSYDTFIGNPCDNTLLVPSVERHREYFGRVPEEVATDRGFSCPKNEKALQDMGVTHVALPAKGKKTAERKRHEKQSWFKRLQRWRAGGEATISRLKRRYSQRRSLFRGNEGTSIWVGLGVFVHNIARVKILLDVKESRRAQRACKNGSSGESMSQNVNKDSKSKGLPAEIQCVGGQFGEVMALAGVN